MSVDIDLGGKVALVTGASQGIGAAIARVLHQAGASIYLNHLGPSGSPPAEDAMALAVILNGHRPHSAWCVPADVSDAEQVRSMMGEIQAQGRKLDILVNNAGILRDRSIAKMSPEDWKAVLDVNLGGVFFSCKYGLEIMNDGGAIVNLGSIAASAGFHGQSNYAAAKGGVHSLTYVLSREASRRGIRVNAVAPGIIDTPLMQAVAPEVRQTMARSIPMGRFGEPGEVAGCVLFLVSSLASYVTGHVLEIHGGWHG